MHALVRRHTRRALGAAVAAPLLAVALLPTAAGAAPSAPARASVPIQASPSAYSGLSDGDVAYANALNLPGTDVAKAEVAQAAAGVNSAGPLATTDQLGGGQPLSFVSTTGKTSFGHGAPVNIGLLGSQTAAPQVKLASADATAPPPSSVTNQLVTIPASPLLNATVLPSSATANTKADGSCVSSGTPISTGVGAAANATVLGVPGATVVTLPGESKTASETQLVTPQNASGQPVDTGNAALETQTVENIAPVTLFAGTPAALTIKVLAPLALKASAGGVAGTANVSYAFVGVGPTDPVLSITAGGQTNTLTSQQVLGVGGLKIGLGLADLTIGTPAHSLTGNETTSPTLAADGTTASAAADFIRITLPGTLQPVGSVSPDSPLAPLNQILGPLASGLSQVTGPIGTALKQAGVGVADVRVGHFEATATVPAGGIVCPNNNPLSESLKDVSVLTAPPGQTFTYDIRVPNRGTLPIENVKVVDTYSAALGFVSSVPPANAHTNNVLTFNLGTLQPNAFDTIVMTFRIPANATQGTVYHNSADISGTYAGKPITQPVSVTGPTVGPVGTGKCDLTHSTKFASNRLVTTGENFGYFINVQNAGGQPCTNVVVNDTLISGVSFVSCTANCTHSGQDVTWNVGTLAPGQSTVVSVVVKVVATSGTLPNIGHITSPSGPPANPSTVGPTVSNTSVAALGLAAGCAGGVCPAAAVQGVMAFTGLDVGVPLTAFGLIAGAAGMFALRRRHG